MIYVPKMTLLEKSKICRTFRAVGHLGTLHTSTKLFAIIYLNLEIYYIVREKLSNIFSYCVLANNAIHRTDAVHV